MTNAKSIVIACQEIGWLVVNALQPALNFMDNEPHLV